MRKFISKNMYYPTSAREQALEGRCYLNFLVNESGEISDIKVMKGVPGCYDCDNEAVRVIKLMPKWNPALIDGKPIKVYHNLPLTFLISGRTINHKLSIEEIYGKIANDYYNIGVKNTTNNELSLAAQNFHYCLRINPKDIDALYNLGTVYFKLNEKEKACEIWSRIKALEKPDADDLIKQYCTN